VTAHTIRWGQGDGRNTCQPAYDRAAGTGKLKNVLRLLEPGLAHRSLVRVLEEDVDLAAVIPADDRQAAIARVRAPVAILAPGPWRPTNKQTDVALGLLVLEGLITRRVRVGRCTATELLGAGDVLQPWEEPIETNLVPYRLDWEVLVPARVAVLDHRFAVAIRFWPEITSALLGRAFRRTRWQGLLLALAHFPRIDVRLLVLFWHLAERWGRVGADGVFLPLPLTHEALARLVGARRPTVTTALGSLRRRGCLRKRPDGHWVLTSQAQSELVEICGP
jgi:CRP/FNR family transcriptional regulator, cyclic AMP receptor protein